MERSMQDWLQNETLSEKTTKKTKPKTNHKANRGDALHGLSLLIKMILKWGSRSAPLKVSNTPKTEGIPTSLT